jgi:hypothetical protein
VPDTPQHRALANPPQAEKQGWDYQVEEPKVANIPPKNYGESELEPKSGDESGEKWGESPCFESSVHGHLGPLYRVP